MPGKKIISAHVDELDAAEYDANHHWLAWRQGEPTPLAALLDDMKARWLALEEDGELELEFTPVKSRRR